MAREQPHLHHWPPGLSHEVEFVAALPRSGTGKILWRELQQAHQGHERTLP
jgi:acyl-coenzyme A synthetase/AMP-(fatty) acid ligase